VKDKQRCQHVYVIPPTLPHHFSINNPVSGTQVSVKIMNRQIRNISVYTC